MTTTALYRHYDADGRLLYVGATKNIRARTEEHMREAEWIALSKRADVVFFPTREEALAAEWAAIEKEAPIYNKVRAQRSKREPKTRAKRLPVSDFAAARAAFPAAWGEYLRGRYKTAYAVERAFGIDSKTARDWISGKRDPSGSFVAAVVASDPKAIEILGRVA